MILFTHGKRQRDLREICMIGILPCQLSDNDILNLLYDLTIITCLRLVYLYHQQGDITKQCMSINAISKHAAYKTDLIQAQMT
jgi:hypothetical protein